jgi:hypothetical protein
MNEQVESVWSIVSRLMMVGDDDDDDVFCSIEGNDEHEQWPNDVIVLNNVKRIGICVDEVVVVVNEWRRSESFNNRSFESKSETWRREGVYEMECNVYLNERRMW